MWTLDTNILVYAFDHRYPRKRECALTVFEAWDRGNEPIGLQVLGEAYRVLTRKLGGQPDQIQSLLSRIALRSRCFGATRASFLNALEWAATMRLSVWDANLVSAAELAGCTHLLSEDMQDGARFGRLQIVNPFAGEELSDPARVLLRL